jgi:competence protein ComEC
VPDPLRVRIFNVGEGDAIAGILPGGQRAFVVDVFDAEPILRFLEAEGVSEVVLFLSHSDLDHIKGVKDFLADFQPPRSILGIFFNRDRIKAGAGRTYKSTLQLIGNVSQRETDRDARHLRAEFNTNLNEMPRYGHLFGPGFNARVVHPAPHNQDSLIDTDTNEASGVLLLEHQFADGSVRKVMLAADVQLTGVSLMLRRAAAGSIEADVLKFPHHGAWPTARPGARAVGVDRKGMDDFLRAVSPRSVILSVGFDNPHGHVRAELFEALRQYHADTGRLESLKCTQFTPTCYGSKALPKDGELARPHCAGDVEIRTGEGVGAGGVEVVTVPNAHPDRVALVHRSGAAQCAFLPEIRSRIAGATPAGPK